MRYEADYFDVRPDVVLRKRISGILPVSFEDTPVCLIEL